MLVVVLGASPNPSRYAFKAQQQLKGRGFEVLPVNPRYSSVLGERCLDSVKDISTAVDTVTVYVGPDRLIQMGEDLVSLNPRRVIFNPGSECPEVEKLLESHGVAVRRECTLVLLSTGQFDDRLAELVPDAV